MNNAPHICSNESCSISQSGAIFPKYQNCPICNSPLISKEVVSFNDREKNIIGKYPYVIAHTFYKMHSEGTTAQLRTFLLKDVINGTLKHLALLVATEYFESSIQNDLINKLFDENLRRHTLGQLHEFIRKSLKELEIGNHSFFIPELPTFYRDVQISRKNIYKIFTPITNELGELINNTEKLTAIDALIHFRNREIGHGLTWSEEKYQQIFNTYYPILLNLLEAMAFVQNYPLCKWEKGYKWSLMGSQISRVEQQTKPRNNGGQIWIENIQGKRLELLPFFILPKSYIIGSPAHVELFVYEDYTGNNIIYLSPENERGITSGSVVEVLRSKLQNKIVKHLYNEESLTKEILAEKSVNYNKILLLELEKEKKIHKGYYQSRVEIESSLKSWVDTRYGLFFIQASSGSGKTNLLVEMQRLYTERKLTSVLIRANRIKTASIIQALEDVLDLQENFNFNKFKVLGYSENNPFVILIDGGNEHNTPVSFLIDVLEFLHSYSGGFIKVILSWRAEFSSELPPVSNRFSSLIYSEKNYENESNILSQKGFYLNPFSNRELEEAWDIYAKGQNRKYKVNFKLEDLSYYDRSLVETLYHPFNLNLFLSLFDNKRPLPKKGKKYNIWEDYWKKIGKDRLQYELLNSLIQIMYNHRINTVPAAILYEDHDFREYLYDNDIKGPYEQLKLKGVLVEYYLNNERYLSFSFEGVYHFLLGEFIRKNGDISSPNNLYNLIEESKMSGIREAIKLLLLKDIGTGYFERLFAILKEHSYFDMFIPPLTLAFSLASEDNNIKPYDIKTLFKQITTINPDDANWILKKVINYCENLQRFDLIKIIYQSLIRIAFILIG